MSNYYCPIIIIITIIIAPESIYDCNNALRLERYNMQQVQWVLVPKQDDLGSPKSRRIMVYYIYFCILVHGLIGRFSIRLTEEHKVWRIRDTRRDSSKKRPFSGFDIRKKLLKQYGSRIEFV